MSNPQVSILLRVLLLSVIVATSAACSSRPNTFDPSGLRERAQGATEGLKGPRPRPAKTSQATQPTSAQAKTSAQQTPHAAQGEGGCVEVSCLDPQAFMIAEGLGKTEDEAKGSGVDELAARIKSSVTSVIKSRYTEGSSVEGSFEGSVEREVKASFRYGELIKYLPAQERDGHLSVITYFSKEAYHDKLKREYGVAVNDVLFQLRDATAPGASPQLFVQAWRGVQAPLKSFELYVTEYQAIFGRTLTPELREADELLAKAHARRRALLSRAQVVVRVEGEGLKALKGPLVSLTQALMSRWQVRARGGDACPAGGWRLELTGGVNTSTHSVTGMGLDKLSWSATLRDCPALTSLSEVQMPALRGAERYNKPARVALVESVEGLRQLVQRDEPLKAEGRGLPRTAAQVSEALKSALVDVLPL